MVREFSAAATDHKNDLESLLPWVFLFEVETLDGTERYRFAAFDRTVHYGLDSLGAPIPYSPAPIALSPVENDAEGGLPTIDVTVANAGPFMSMVVDSNDGFVDQPMRVMLVSTDDLEAAPLVDEDTQVQDCTITSDGFVFSLAGRNLFEADFPPFLYQVDRCKWAFGGELCGYQTGLAGAGFKACGVRTDGTVVAEAFTLDACTVAGNDEEARGLVRLHPRRWGAEPGMKRL